MSDSSITQILFQLRQAETDEQREAAAERLFRCYRPQVERVARGRLHAGGGLSDEEDVAQSAFRSFFGRIETGQLDALVNGGQVWAILAKLTRNKAIDSVRYDNAQCRGGEGGRRRSEPRDVSADGPQEGQPSSRSVPRAPFNRLGLEDEPPKDFAAEARHEAAGDTDAPRTLGRREEVPLEAVRDRSQRSGDEQVASSEVIEYFLEQLSEATLRGIVALKMDGFTNDEIAEQLGCATRTVERKLNLIRRLWIPILESSDEHRES